MTDKKKIYYETKSDLEIIKKYQELTIYVYKLIKKYPEYEQFNLTNDTKQSLLQGLEYLNKAKITFDKKIKLNYLLEAKTNINILIVFVRIAIKLKYITSKNYTAWSYKIYEINIMLEKWIRSCRKP